MTGRSGLSERGIQVSPKRRWVGGVRRWGELVVGRGSLIGGVVSRFPVFGDVADLCLYQSSSLKPLSNSLLLMPSNQLLLD